MSLRKRAEKVWEDVDYLRQRISNMSESRVRHEKLRVDGTYGLLVSPSDADVLKPTSQLKVQEVDTPIWIISDFLIDPRAHATHS